MKTLHQTLIAGLVSAACLAGTGMAQTVVVGTGDADQDIAAVQAAVDHGGAVTLRGHFSFDNPPARRGKLPDLMAMVLVTKEVTISGTWDEQGQMATIEGGEIPFAVEAPGAKVRIERVRFVRPRLFAIFVDEVSGLEIDSTIIEGVLPLPLPCNPSPLTSGVGIFVSTVIGLPTLERPGRPGNVSGRLSIVNNQIREGAPADHGIGIMVVNVGTVEAPVTVDIAGNTIRDTTLKGINVTQIGGQARIERNTITTSTVSPDRVNGFKAGIHCGGSGSYLVAHNTIDVADPAQAGIRVRGYPALGAAIEHAIITDNDLSMLPPEGAAFGVGNAAIEIMGLARGTVVQRNRLRGHARTGLAVTPDKAGEPAGNAVDGNDDKNLVSAAGEVRLK